MKHIQKERADALGGGREKSGFRRIAGAGETGSVIGDPRGDRSGRGSSTMLRGQSGQSLDGGVGAKSSSITETEDQEYLDSLGN